MNKNILIVTTFNDNYNFFRRLEKVFAEKGYNFYYLTNKKSILNNLVKARKNFSAIEKVSKYSNHKFDFSQTTELTSRTISKRNAGKLTNSVLETLAKITLKKDFEYIFMWNGYRLIEKATTYFAEQNKIKTCFFELGNFPNKIFCDPLGTNATSLLAKDKSVLDGFNTSTEDYKKWAEEYRTRSLHQHVVPQGKTAKGISYGKNLSDLTGFAVNNLVKFEPVFSIKKLRNKLFVKKASVDYDTFELNNVKYIFYPMQLSIDSQLLINSDVDNFDAITEAARQAKEKGCKLIVKPHPAEIDKKIYKHLYKLRDELGFLLTDKNTIELVDRAEKVITINSTVGLQALILNKDVQCLGRSFYSDFSYEDLAAYIQNYLLDIEFWDKSPVDPSAVDKILKRTELADA